MISFRVEGMTCGHCVSTVTKALNRVDPEASVHIDLADHRVDVASDLSHPDRFAAAIRDAGYAALAVAVPTGHAGSVAPQRSGCCCA